MTNTMTPSEIADWHQTIGDTAAYNGEEGPCAFHNQAAATISELEGRVAHYEKAFANAQNADAEANGLLLAKLKIATEALEEIVHIAREMVGTGTAVDNDAAWAWAVGLKATSYEANQALARIREVV